MSKNDKFELESRKNGWLNFLETLTVYAYQLPYFVGQLLRKLNFGKILGKCETTTLKYNQTSFINISEATEV